MGLHQLKMALLVPDVSLQRLTELKNKNHQWKWTFFIRCEYLHLKVCLYLMEHYCAWGWYPLGLVYLIPNLQKEVWSLSAPLIRTLPGTRPGSGKAAEQTVTQFRALTVSGFPIRVPDLPIIVTWQTVIIKHCKIFSTAVCLSNLLDTFDWEHETFCQAKISQRKRIELRSSKWLWITTHCWVGV